MNAPFISVLRPSAQSGAAQRCASAMPQQKKKGRVRRAGGRAVTPAARRDRPPLPVTIHPRNPRSSRKP